MKLDGTIFTKTDTTEARKKEKRLKLAADIAVDVANFLARGGKIQRIEKGVMTIDVKKTDHKERDFKGRLWKRK